jgi:DNA (cytosine-5)-methyltransferase 1
MSEASVAFARKIVEACGVASPDAWEGVHLFTSPCPGFSPAGLMNVDDPRNRLVFAMLPILAATPRSRMIFENVPTFLAEKYATIQDELFAGIGALRGMTLTCEALRAYRLYAPDYGLPQGRERLIFPIMREGESMPPPPPRTCEKYVTIGDAIGVGFKDRDPRHMPLSPLERRLVMTIPPGGDCRDGIKRDWYLREYAIEHGWNGRTNLIRVCSWDSVAPTVVANPHTNISRVEALHPSRRRFTQGERLKLQGFPDWWVVLGPLEEGNKQTGNAVPPPLMEAAFRQYMADLLG